MTMVALSRGNGEEAQRRLYVTLTNLSFLPAIFLALNWQHFHLVPIYILAMISSMLYHWCDSSPLWPSSDDCIVQYDILQFADFFLAGVSGWATILSMAMIGNRLRIFCLSTAFILFAITIHSVRFHIATFAIPLSIVSFIAVSSWIYRCKRLHTLYPPGEGLIRLSIGVCLVVISALLYIRFQDGVSYEYIHGTWHIIVQLSACCMLPKPIPDKKDRLDASKSWIVKTFPVFDKSFWRKTQTKPFWNSQIDECCGVSTTSSPTPSIRSPTPSVALVSQS